MEQRPDRIDWQQSINNPVYTSDGKEIGFISSVQTDKIIVTSGPLAPDKFLVPKSSIHSFENGTVYLKEDSKFVSSNYQFE
jgi:rRNA processing protein Gar1